MQWIFSLVLEIVEYISNSLLNVFSMDMAYFEYAVPVTKDIVSILHAAGWALLMGNLVFQAIRSMVAGLGFEGEDPKFLFSRTFIFSFLLLVSRQICDIGLSMTATVIEMLQVPSSIQIPVPEETVFPIGASWLLVLIIGFVVMWQVIRLFFEVGERYVVTAVLTILSPLAFSMGGSKSTEDIFKGWVRMFASMCLMMVFNVIFLKMLLSVLAVMPDGVDVLPWMILVMGIARVARKIDGIIARIGLNPAITGDGLGKGGIPGMLAFSMARSLGGTVLKTIGKNGGHPGTAGGDPGGGNHTPPGGAGGGGSGSRFYGRTGNFDGSGAKRGRSSSTVHASSSQQNRTTFTAGRTAPQDAATQSAHTPSDIQSRQQTVPNSRGVGHPISGDAATQRASPHTPSSAPASFHMAGTPGQPDSSRRTSVRQERGGWGRGPSPTSRGASSSALAHPDIAGMTRSGSGARQRGQDANHTETAPQRTSIAREKPSTVNGTAGTQEAASVSRSGSTHFSAVLSTARQEAPTGIPGGAVSTTSRQSTVSTGRTDASTRQTSVSTQKSVRERSNTHNAVPQPKTQSGIQPKIGAAPSGMAGIPANRRAERPVTSMQHPTGADDSRVESAISGPYPETRPVQSVGQAGALGSSLPRPVPAQQEKRQRSYTGNSLHVPGPSPDTAGTAQATKGAGAPTRRAQRPASPAERCDPAKPMTKAGTPGGAPLPRQRQEGRSPHQKRGDKNHGT